MCVVVNLLRAVDSNQPRPEQAVWTGEPGCLKEAPYWVSELVLGGSSSWESCLYLPLKEASLELL